MNDSALPNQALIGMVCREMSTDINDLRNSILSIDSGVGKQAAARLFVLSGICRTARLRALSAILAAAGRLAEKTEGGSHEIVEALSVFLKAVQNHLQEIVSEHINTPVSLSKQVYLSGHKTGENKSPDAIAGALFIPYTIDDATGAPWPTQIDEASYRAALDEYRTAFQASLWRLVKAPGAEVSSLIGMRQALVTLEPKNPFHQWRIFFDASIAFIEGAIKREIVTEYEKKLCHAIHAELARAGSPGDEPVDEVLSSLLYRIALSESSTARIKKIQEKYQLDGYISNPNGVDVVVAEKFAKVMERTKEAWSNAVHTGDISSFKPLIQNIHHKQGHLKNPGFSVLSGAMEKVAEYLQEHPEKISDDTFSVEVASIILVMERQLREGSNIDIAGDYASKILALIGITSVRTGRDDIAGLPDSRQHISVIHTLANEILVDMGGVEQMIMDFMDEGDDRVLDEIQHALARITRVLKILRSDEPARLVALFSEVVSVGVNQNPDRLAVIFAHLTGMIDLLRESEPACVEAAKRGLIEFAEKPEEISQPEPDMAAEDEDVANDPELLGIFIDEASDIVTGMKNDIATLGQHPGDVDMLSRIRRAFHTLKGSGRMVGLKRFGEVAWQMEEMLNRWLSSRRSVSTDLLETITLVSGGVATWIENFKQNSRASIDVAEVEKRIALLCQVLDEAEKGQEVKKEEAERISDTDESKKVAKSDFDEMESFPGFDEEVVNEAEREADKTAVSTSVSDFLMDLGNVDADGDELVYDPVVRKITPPVESQAKETLIVQVQPSEALPISLPVGVWGGSIPPDVDQSDEGFVPMKSEAPEITPVDEPEEVPVVAAEPQHPVVTAEMRLAERLARLKMVFGESAVSMDGVVSETCRNTPDDLAWNLVEDYVLAWNECHHKNPLVVTRNFIVREIAPVIVPDEVDEEDTSWLVNRNVVLPSQEIKAPVFDMGDAVAQQRTGPKKADAFRRGIQSSENKNVAAAKPAQAEARAPARKKKRPPPRKKTLGKKILDWFMGFLG